MFEACESTCHESTSKEEVENHKEWIVVEKEELIIKKNIENQGNNVKKTGKKACHVNSMKVNYEKAIKVNNEFMVNVDEQQDDIKHIKEQCDIDDENEVQEITAARTPLKNKRPMCVTCNQTFLMKIMLKKHIHEEHTEL